MKKISIVGVEGSGKTVLMSVLGDVYSVPNKDGLFLNPRNKETFEYCVKTVADMRNGHWPQVTEPGQIFDLQWSLCRARDGRQTESLGDVTMMDFAGEVYREAFGKSELSESFRSDVESLQKYVAQCDKLLILINLKDIIDGDRSDQRTIDMLWTSKSIIDYAREHGICDIAIAFTQSERYSGIIDECGGAQGALRKYHSLIFALYPNLNVFTLSAVKETVLNDMAIEIPTQDFHSVGLDGLIKWMAGKGRRQWLKRVGLIREHMFFLLAFAVFLPVAGAIFSYCIFQIGKENARYDWIEIPLYFVSLAILIISIVASFVMIVKYIKNPREMIEIWRAS